MKKFVTVHYQREGSCETFLFPATGGAVFSAVHTLSVLKAIVDATLRAGEDMRIAALASTNASGEEVLEALSCAMTKLASDGEAGVLSAFARLYSVDREDSAAEDSYFVTI